MLSEHSTRAIGLELDFRLISHFAPFSPTRSLVFFVFFLLCFYCLSLKFSFHKTKSAWDSQGCAFPSFQKLILCHVQSRKSKWNGEKKREREVENDWRRKSGYVQYRAMDDSKTEGKMEGWQMEGYESFGTLKESKRREREYAKQKYRARSNWGGTCKVDYKCNLNLYINDNLVAQLL